MSSRGKCFSRLPPQNFLSRQPTPTAILKVLHFCYRRESRQIGFYTWPSTKDYMPSPWPCSLISNTGTGTDINLFVQSSTCRCPENGPCSVAFGNSFTSSILRPCHTMAYGLNVCRRIQQIARKLSESKNVQLPNELHRKSRHRCWNGRTYP